MIKYSLYGNTEVWHNLVNDSLINQVAHAYLFTGPVGIGKATTAKEYIKYLLSANEVLAKRIDEGNFLDLLYICKQDKNEISIDMIRKARDFFKQTPAEGEKKFVIIDSADDLNLNAANALLKILEEPSKNTYLFLISHTPNTLLATIRSRARLIKFKPISPKELKLIANMSKALELEDFVAGSAARAIMIEESDVISIYTKLLELLQSNDILAFNKIAEQLIKQHWQLITQLLEYLISRLIKISAGCSLNLSEIEQEILIPLATKKTLEEWFFIRDDILKSISQAEIYNLDKKQVLLFSLEKIRLQITLTAFSKSSTNFT
jgi:DNA polymerase-3 subunit delta'